MRFMGFMVIPEFGLLIIYLLSIEKSCRKVTRDFLGITGVAVYTPDSDRQRSISAQSSS